MSHRLPLPLGTAVRDALLIVVGCVLLAVAVNTVHPRAIPLVAEHEYEILVPCPEPGGQDIRVMAKSVKPRLPISCRADPTASCA